MRRTRNSIRSLVELNREISKSIEDSWLSIWVIGPFVLLPNFVVILVNGSILAWVIFISSLGIVIQAIRRIQELKKTRKQLLENPENSSELRVEPSPSFSTIFWFWR